MRRRTGFFAGPFARRSASSSAARSMPDTADPVNRARAAKPLPKPGIMDIHAYVPGKAQADGVENPIKLSANENILGASPKAREAFVGAAD